MSLLCCRLVVYDLCLQVRKDCVYCKETIKDNDILIGLCKPPLHFSFTKSSRKLLIAHDEQVQGERHEKFGELARVDLLGEKRRQAGRLCRSISSVRTRNRSSYFKSTFSCIS